MATKAQGNDCYEKVGPDEPVFTLRARDPFASYLVTQWALMAESAGCPNKKVTEAFTCATKMAQWPEKKVPD